MKESEIWEYLAGTASAHTREKVEQWRHSDAFDEEAFAKMERIYQATENTSALDDEDYKKLKKNTLEKLEKQPQTDTLYFARIAAAAVILLAAMGWLFFPSQFKRFFPKQDIVASASFSGKHHVQLPDGTTVLLNKKSKLTYAKSFGENNRQVTLHGEGYFDVKHDSSRPFIVHVGDIQTTVLGTAFNIKTVEESSEVVVTVTRGMVSVGNKEKRFDTILPNEQLTVNTKTHEFKKISLYADQDLHWKDDFLILNDVTMQKAAKLISQKFNVKVVIADQNLKTKRVTGTFMKSRGLKYILKMVSRTMQATYEINDETVIIKSKEKF